MIISCLAIITSPKVFATGEIEQLHAFIHSQHGTIGETVIVPVEVEVPTSIRGLKTQCVVTLEYPKTSLVCLSEDASVTIGAAFASSDIAITVEASESGSDVALMNVPFLLTFGDTELADISITNIRWEVTPGNWEQNGSGEFEYQFVHGVVQVDDIFTFQDGSKRLLHLPFATAHAGPNPFAESTTLYVSNPSTSVHCAVYTLHGELVHSVGTLDATNGRDEHEIRLSAAELPASGLYFVVLSSETERTSFSLVLR